MSSPIFLFIIIFLTMQFAIYCHGRNSSFGCVPREKKALLKFKASLSDPSGRLSSWDNDHNDCCTWDGVMCDEFTGHVIGLDLRNEGYHNKPLLGNQLDSSLLELKHLSYLDLSRNYFRFSPIPAFLGSMKQLQHLDLSTASFSGAVPQSLGNLSSLRTLDLHVVDNFEASYYPFVDDIMWASNLSSLEHLDLSNIDLSRTNNLIEVLGILPSLSKLRLSSSGLNNTHLPHTCQNSTLFIHIQYLDLSQNLFEGELPCFLQNMSSLRVVDLSASKLSGPITSSLGNLSSLRELNLGSNNLGGEIPYSLGQLSNLEIISISHNTLSGSIPSFLRNLTALRELYFESNQLSGEIPIFLGQLSNLEIIYISNNILSGSIPSSLGNLSILRELRLRSNELSGEIPTSLGQLSNLEVFDISANSFNGSLSEAHFANLTKLTYLDASYNLFKFNVRLDWVPPFQLFDLNLHSIYIGGQFPRWLQTQKSLDTLDMSNCSISGTLPDWLQYLNLYSLHLSNNHIGGSIPKLASSMRVLDLSNNTINHLPRDIGHMMPSLMELSLAKNSVKGPIPDSLCEMDLLVLDLSNNYLSGHLPDCWENVLNLWVMRLSSNKLSGIIPNSIGAAYGLQWLHLNNNSFTGHIPSSLKNCTGLELVDIGDNKLTGKLPEWDGKYWPDLKYLGLRGNEFYGVIPSSFCQMTYLQVIDLSNNKLTGQIPHCFGDFLGMMINRSEIENRFANDSMRQVIKRVEQDFTSTLRYLVNLDLSRNNLIGEIPSELTNLSALVGLNLSHNRLEGKIPAKIGDMKSLESLDLSSNNLSGNIPHGLADLNSLSHLNLSNNNLSGEIPKGNQLQTFEDPSMYEDNPDLCGAPLPKKCHVDRAGPNTENHVGADKDDHRAERIYLYGFIISGFAAGFWGVIGVLFFKRGWRHAIFRFTEVAFDKIWRS